MAVVTRFCSVDAHSDPRAARSCSPAPVKLMRLEMDACGLFGFGTSTDAEVLQMLSIQA